MAKFIILSALSLPPSCRLSFPIVGLKIFSLLTFALKSPHRIFIWNLRKGSTACSNPSQKLSFEFSLSSSLGVCTIRIIKLRQRPLRNIYIYTGCNRRKGQNFGRVFHMLKYTDITQNTYIQSWTVTEIMAREKCGLLAGLRTVPVSWQVLSMFVLEWGVGFSSH